MKKYKEPEGIEIFGTSYYDWFDASPKNYHCLYWYAYPDCSISKRKSY